MFSYNGMYVSVAVVICLYCSALRIMKNKRTGLKDLFYPAPVAILLGFVFARIFYVVFNDDLYPAFSDKLVLTDGGYMLYGAFFGAILALVLYCIASHKRKLLLPLLDIISAGGALAVCVGRLGSAFYEECYGLIISNEALCRLPFAVYIPSLDQYCMAVFLYESVACFLIWLALRRIRKIYRGTVGAEIFHFAVLYAGVRTFTESLRADSVYYGFVRVSQIISVLILLALFICISVKTVKLTAFKKSYIISYLLFAVALTCGVCAEFYMGSSSYTRNYIVLLICCCVLTALNIHAYRVYYENKKVKK